MKATLPQHIRLDERERAEKPLLDQLSGLGWEVIDITDKKRTPAAIHRECFMPGAARAAQGHQPRLEHDQVEEAVKQLAGEYRVTPFLESVESN